MFGFFSNIGNDLFRFGAIILGGMLLFFRFRSHYIEKGEAQAMRRYNEHTLRKIIKGKQIEERYNGDKGEDIHRVSGTGGDDWMWKSDAITHS